MKLTYSYFPAKECGYIGYWNDYPDHYTQGETLQELKYMLRDLRKCINEMIADGTWTEKPKLVGYMVI